MPYTDRADLELRFGADNIEQWADLDNKADATAITNRINKYLQYADDEINSLLEGGPYTVPFSEPYPPMIVNAAAELAASKMYMDGRGITDANPDNNQMANVHKHAYRVIHALLSGRVVLPGLHSTRAPNYPSVVSFDDE